MTAMTVGVAVDLASGLLLALLGTAIATVKPRRPGNLVLAAFSAAYGLIYVFWNLRTGSRDAFDLAMGSAQAATLGATGVLVVLLALRFPRPLGRGERPLLAPPVVVAGGFVLATLAGAVVEGGRVGVGGVAFATYYGGFLFALALIVLRHRAGGGEEGARDRIQARLLHGALVLFPAFLLGGGFADDPGPMQWAAAGAFVLVSGLWLRTAARLPAGEARHARNAALLPLALILAGLVASTFAPGGFVTIAQSGLHGVLRTLTVLVLAYAILRHQLLGLDVRVRWTISKSTVAAAFVAVFFIASEGAQILFGKGNEWAGLFAAGALVFALAPLQRAAERLAERAVPTHPEPPPSSRPPLAAAVPVAPLVDAEGPPVEVERESMYRGALRLVLKDRAITRAEERELFRLARGLGLAPERAHELLVETERELHAEVRP